MNPLKLLAAIAATYSIGKTLEAIKTEPRQKQLAADAKAREEEMLTHLRAIRAKLDASR